MGRLSFLALTVILVVGIPRSDAHGSEARARIFRVEPLEADGFRLFATILAQGEAPVPLEDVETLEVFQLSSGGQRGRLEYFTDGSPHERKENKAQALSSSDVPLDVVFLVSGNADRDRSESLNQAVREAALLMAKQLPANSRANLIWVTDTLSFMVMDPRKSGELSKTRSSRKWCRDQDRGYYQRLAETGPIVSEHPCGLVSDRSGIESALQDNSATTAFDGFYPVLLGLPWRLCAASAGEPHELQDLVGQGRDEYVLKEIHTGALDVAISLLIQYGRPEAVRAIVALVDGKDGYLLAADECRPVVSEQCRNQYPNEDPTQCTQRLVKQRLYGPQQLDFLEKARRALPLMQAGRIRLDAILLPTALPHEAERMRLLSIKSGGTPRIVDTEQEIIPAAEATIKELTDAYVLDIFPNVEQQEDFDEDEPMRLGIKAELFDARRERISIDTAAIQYEKPTIDSGVGGIYPRTRNLLAEKVGVSTANMILRGLLIALSLILLALVGKMVRKMISAVRQ